MTATHATSSVTAACITAGLPGSSRSLQLGLQLGPQLQDRDPTVDPTVSPQRAGKLRSARGNPGYCVSLPVQLRAVIRSSVQ